MMAGVTTRLVATSDAPELDVLIADDGYWRQRLES